MGKELGITYEEVKAYQASQGINTYAADSNGGYTTGGVYVEWEVTSGFTGQGWDETNNESQKQTETSGRRSSSTSSQKKETNRKSHSSVEDKKRNSKASKNKENASRTSGSEKQNKVVVSVSTK